MSTARLSTEHFFVLLALLSPLFCQRFFGFLEPGHGRGVRLERGAAAKTFHSRLEVVSGVQSEATKNILKKKIKTTKR